MNRLGGSILPSLEATDNPPIEPLITVLINELSTSKSAFYVVLDDYHLITRQTIHDAIEFFLQHIPPNAHLVLCGRIDPPFTLSRLRAGSHMTEIRSQDLRFNEAEVTVFLNDLIGLDLPPDDIGALLSRTEGWVTGLQLAALSMQGRQDKHEFITAFSGSHHYIIDYLVDEVMARQPEEIRAFLCRTSILDRFCAPLCDQVSEISTSKEILQDLDEANLFLIPLDDERIWYRYHHLFSDFLTQRLLEREPRNIPELHRRASQWLEQNDLIIEAINHSIAGDDFEHTARLVESIGPDMMMQSEFDQLAIWLDAMPQEFVQAWPWLCIIRAWMYQRWARLDDAEHFLQYAEHALEVDIAHDPAGGENVIRGQISAIRALIALNRTQIPQSIEFANQALELLPIGHFNRAVAALALGLAKRATGNFDEAIKVFVEARRDSLAVGNRILAQAILVHMGYAQTLQGRLHKAAETLNEAIQLTYHRTEIKIPYASTASVNLADIHREWNKLDAAMIHLKEGIEIGKQAQVVDAVVQGYTVMTRVHLAQGALEAAIETCQNAERMMDEIPDLEPDTLSKALDSRVRLIFAQDNLSEAYALVREKGLIVHGDIKHFMEFDHFILARVLIHLGRADPEANHLSDAQDLITRILDITKPSGCTWKVIPALALQALTFQAQSKDELAISSLEEALTLAEPEGYVRTFVDEGEPMRDLLRQVGSQGLAVDYVDKLLTAFDRDEIKERPALSQSIVEPLSERELDVLKLLSTEMSGPEIARQLMVSLNTMRTHTKNIYSKLGVNNRRAAVRRAEDLDLK